MATSGDWHTRFVHTSLSSNGLRSGGSRSSLPPHLAVMSVKHAKFEQPRQFDTRTDQRLPVAGRSEFLQNPPEMKDFQRHCSSTYDASNPRAELMRRTWSDSHFRSREAQREEERFRGPTDKYSHLKNHKTLRELRNAKKYEEAVRRCVAATGKFYYPHGTGTMRVEGGANHKSAAADVIFNRLPKELHVPDMESRAGIAPTTSQEPLTGWVPPMIEKDYENMGDEMKSKARVVIDEDIPNLTMVSTAKGIRDV